MGKSLKIGVVAPPWNRVPPETYGGSELIIDILCRGFAERGHQPVLFASGDSTCPVQQRHFIDKAVMPPDKYQEHIHMAGFLKACQEQQFDIIHSHLEAIMPYADLINCPVVCTLHVEVTPMRSRYLSYNKSVKFISISEKHASHFPIETKTIMHGLELETFPFTTESDHYVLFVGEITERKGTDIAALAAMELGIPLKIAGYLPPENKLWFEERVMSRGSGNEIEYLGMVSHEEKLRLMSRAKALLCPIRWEEPFGLVVIEALACGTPVVAMARGSFPELIRDGKCGFLSNNEDEFIDKLSRIDELDPRLCRTRVEKLFSHHRMVDDYIDYFHSIIE